VVGVATSYQSRVLARQFGVKTVSVSTPRFLHFNANFLREEGIWLIRNFTQVLADGLWTKIVSGYIWGKLLLAAITL
jgi:hypothetical protein